MQPTPDFLDRARPDVPDLVVSRAVVPFHLPGRDVRGRLVRLGALADALLSRHDEPDAVRRLAGRTLALAASLATALKFRGSFSVQAKGDGPVSMLLADCTDDGALRAYARADAARLAALPGNGAPSDRALLGDGYLAFTVDQGPDTDRHQGIVAIEGDTLDAMARHYFETSEQHDCWIRLACARTAEGWRAGALVLERIAAAGGAAAPVRDLDPGDRPAGLPAPEADDPSPDWTEAVALAATLTEAELLDDGLAPETLLHRLFHEGGVAADRPRALAYGCRCSRAKLASILATFPADDLDHMTVGADIVMRCEFCAYDFRFERASIAGAADGPARPD